MLGPVHNGIDNRIHTRIHTRFMLQPLKNYKKLTNSLLSLVIKPYKHVSIYLLFIMLYMMVLTFVSVDKILKCDLSNESY